jgi:hypothetical protein
MHLVLQVGTSFYEPTPTDAEAGHVQIDLGNGTPAGELEAAPRSRARNPDTKRLKDLLAKRRVLPGLHSRLCLIVARLAN